MWNERAAHPSIHVAWTVDRRLWLEPQPQRQQSRPASCLTGSPRGVAVVAVRLPKPRAARKRCRYAERVHRSVPIGEDGCIVLYELLIVQRVQHFNFQIWLQRAPDRHGVADRDIDDAVAGEGFSAALAEIDRLQATVRFVGISGGLGARQLRVAQILAGRSQAVGES